MKSFVFDRLVDRENICNLEREQRAIRSLVGKKANIVVYAPRNFGKTSVVKNVIAADFRTRNRKSFIYFTDLMGVRSIESLERRLAASLARSFESSFPAKGFLEAAGRFLGALRPEISIDAATGTPSISLGSIKTDTTPAFGELWKKISLIAGELPSLIVLDEFQDIGSIDEAPEMMREALESFGPVPVILLGSKRHMLADLFARPDAALNGWGTDVEFAPIAFETYHAYIAERFLPRGLEISVQVAQQLQEMMQRVPEAINRLCRQILDMYQNTSIERDHLFSALTGLLEGRESRYEALLSRFTPAEEKILTEISILGVIDKPQSKGFLARVELSNRAVAAAIRRLMNYGLLENENSGYRLTDPLLRAHLVRYR